MSDERAPEPAPEETTPSPSPPAGRRHGLAVYTLLRLGLLAVVWALVWLVVTRSWLWSLAIALVISGVLSLFLLDRHRDAASGSVAGFFRRLNQRIDASTRAEDED